MPHRLRDLVADTATRLGADAPTLCSPWRVRDLLAHIVVRESRPDALPGIGLPLAPLQRHTESLQEEAATRPFGELVDQVRRGPAALWPTRIPAVDRAVNLGELSIHHEDMVRAQPDWEPTALPPEVKDGLWRTLRTAGRMLYRTAPTGIVLVADGYGRVALRRPPEGAGTVVLRGDPLELTLHAFGRTEVATVQAQGDDGDLAALERHRRSA